MSFRSIGDITTAINDGKVREYMSRKVPIAASTAYKWFDLSMSPGNPPPKYWFDATPLVAKAIYQSTDGGLYHGPNVSPSNKYLKKLTLTNNTSIGGSSTPCLFYIMDYLLYYPTIDDGVTDPQVMDNTVTLPRYTDGKGVQMMLVTTGTRTGSQTFTVSYTNSDGVSGRTTPLCTFNADAYVGAIATHNNQNTAAINVGGPFLPLQDGDSGVRSVQSFTMNGVDVGLSSLLLVKPLATISMSQYVTVGTVSVYPVEKDFLIQELSLPRIYDDAFLGMIIKSGVQMATNNIVAQLQIIWD